MRESVGGLTGAVHLSADPGASPGAPARAVDQVGRGEVTEEKPKGSVRRLWNKHGGGYYALIAVSTFLFLEVTDLWSAISSAESVRGFMASELITFGIESFFNTLWASIWPVHWFTEYGWTAIYVLGGGYLLWVIALAAALDRREKAFKKELGL